MNNIEYNIGLNDEGRPHIYLPDDYNQNPDDRFFAIEVTRYILQDVLSRRTPELDSKTVKVMDETERLLGQIGDEMAAILYDNMKALAETSKMLGSQYNVSVNNIEERDILPEFNILYDGKIFSREIGFKVAVFDDSIYIYELVDGITNEHWVKL